MATPEQQRRWWGWGLAETNTPPAKGFLDWLKARVSPWPDRTFPVPDLESIDLRPPLLPDGLENELARAVGGDHLKKDPAGRILHAYGRSYRDLVRIRLGQFKSPPDLVVYPENHDQVRAVLEASARHAAAVVPYGGGTSVVGGLEQPPLIRPLVCLDLARLNRIKHLDRQNLTVLAETGIMGPDLEAALNREGLTLGHFPQSFEFSSLGGWIATRGAGHKSTRYGKIEDMVLALRLACPDSEMQTPSAPHPAAGGDLTSLFIGSEGSLGVITEATMKVKRLPDASWSGAYLLPDFEAGVDAVREIMAKGFKPATIRLSDAVETSALMAEAVARKKGRFQKAVMTGLLPRYLRWKGLDGTRICLLLVLGEGSVGEVKVERQGVWGVVRAHGGLSTGSAPAQAWHETRYQTPYLRDELLTAGFMTETLETSSTWDRIIPLFGRVESSLEAALDWSGVKGTVMAHLSHAYGEGANLYFTFMAPLVSGAEEEQWRRAKEAATGAIMAGGGALSHHHGVGRDHKPWLTDFWGKDAVRLFQAAKTSLDPLALLNPGILFDADPAPFQDGEPSPLTFSPETRQHHFQRFEQDVFDLAVIGGGIVGAGVAWDAALRGLSTALVEKNDFGSGTSGKSSRMIHGGLRYLKMLDIKLVRESLTERHHLLRMAPHLVKPMEHIMPIYKGEGDRRTIVHIGLWGYDALAGEKGLPEHRNLSKEETLERVPILSTEGLEGGLLYYDGLTDDARLTLETVKAAGSAGAVAVNHAEAVGLDLGGPLMTIQVRDTLTGRESTLRARFIVNAAGVWADRVRQAAQPESHPMLRPAKGIHITYPRNLTPIDQVVVFKGSDGRPLFAVPSGDMIYIGTTDTDFNGDLDDPHADTDEVDYLIEAVNRVFDQANLTRDQITSSWAGIRPLISDSKDKSSSNVSREYDLRLESDRFCTVCGGKLTTFRSMAAQTVDLVMSVLSDQPGPPSSTANLMLCGVGPDRDRPQPHVRSPLVISRLEKKYGPRAAYIMELARSPQLNAVLDQDLGLIAAEVYWAVKAEMAMTLADAMIRRLSLFYLTPDNGLGLVDRVADIMAGILKWNQDERADQIKKYEQFIGRETSYRIQ